MMNPISALIPTLMVGLASAGLMLTGCGSSDLATAIPSTTSASLVTAEPASISGVEESTLPPFVDELELTEAQLQAAEQIRLDRQAQIRAVLTPEQIALLESFEGEDRQAFRTLREQLNLSSTQKEQIAEILAATKEHWQALLTPDQLDTLADLVSSAEGLNLSDQQYQQAEQILEAHRAQVRAVLTPEQIAVLESFQGSDREAFIALQDQLNLTADQKDQIAAIRAESRAQLQGLLTSEQRSSLESFKTRFEQFRARQSQFSNG